MQNSFLSNRTFHKYKKWLDDVKRLTTYIAFWKVFCCCWNKPYDAPPTNRTKPVWRYSCNLPLFCKDQNYARCLASQSRRASSFFLFENRRLNGLESRFLFDVILFSDNPLKILSYHNAKINSYLTHKNYSVVISYF